MSAFKRCMGPWPACGHADNTCTACPAYQASIPPRPARPANAYTQARERLAEAQKVIAELFDVWPSDSVPPGPLCIRGANIINAAPLPPLAGPDREAMIDAAARAYFDTDFAPRAAAFNGRATPPYDEIMEHIRTHLRLKVTPLADAILLLIGGGGE